MEEFTWTNGLPHLHQPTHKVTQKTAKHGKSLNVPIMFHRLPDSSAQKLRSIINRQTNHDLKCDSFQFPLSGSQNAARTADEILRNKPLHNLFSPMMNALSFAAQKEE